MSEEEVIQYLSSTPDFFTRHADVLEGLTLPHPINAKVVSLLEYQVTILRQKNASYKAEFEHLVDVARENASTLQKSRRLVLAGLSCVSLEDFAVVIDDIVREDFAVPHHALILYSDKVESSVRTHQLVKEGDLLAHTVGFIDCFCGMLPANELDILFPQSGESIRSVAVLPLLSREGGEIKKRGVLVLGANAEATFGKSKGVLFLQYLADLLSAILLRLMP
ncbi:DUF484 family protein [Marinomonas sp. IMCC 4694]|uniref:DUF484 family protein n=1 Tax=Marinomonas sp. IMCC 4694 TaxID=2605432 RepID=UPI0011E80A70|nr:DUF484 family protein [Marinomonas sp. IMCC 4694]TYL48625.1 DUF484 family protein [Marinomonas sp. IMCC 4694]